MTIRSGLVVLFRLFLILLFLQVLIFCFTLIANPGLGLTPKGYSIVLVFGAGLVLVAVAAIRHAGVIVDALAPLRSEAAPEEGLTVDMLQAIGFSMVGAFLVYSAIIQTVGLLIPVAFETGYYLAPIRAWIAPGITWIAGIYLLFGALGLRQWLVTIRQAGRGNRD